MSITGLHLLAIALGGAFGGIGRFWVSGVVARRFGERFPWGTLVVNVTGAALIGMVAGALLAPDMGSVRQSSIWALLVIGVLGSYTTVSSFSVQTLALVRSGERARAAANVAASLSLCLGSAAAAYMVVLWMVRA
jgi:fluoride exporter